MSEDRTWLATVLFMDIVEYSMIPVNQQLQVKLHFQQLVAHETRSLEDSDTLRLDTGDGMAICYLGDPERMYPIGRRLRDEFSDLASHAPYEYQVRLGLNLGPVKIIEDLNHERNCIGAGINDAQRVMAFAAPNQLLVSKSYFEMVSKMSRDYGQQLRHLGLRADKHDQQHDIYELAVEVVKVDDFPEVILAPAEDDADIKPAADFDEAVIRRISEEYAHYVGQEQARHAIDEAMRNASSVAQLCSLLSDKLTDEDDRYSFNEYLKYYGYTGY